MPENDYATKQDVAVLRKDVTVLQQHVTVLQQNVTDLRAHVDVRFDQIIEATRDMQTEVLRAFHNWASPTDIKIRSHEERITMLEERLREIEGGRLTKH